MPIKIHNPITHPCHVCGRVHPLNPFERSNVHYALACSHTCGVQMSKIKEADPDTYYALRRHALKAVANKVARRAKKVAGADRRLA